VIKTIPRLNWKLVKIHKKKIGQGATATVHLGQYLGETCAVKKIYCSDLTMDSLNVMMEEVALTWHLQHDSTVKFHGFYISLPDVCLVYEYCSRGTLKDVLLKAGKEYHFDEMPGPEHFARGVARSLAFMHDHVPKVIHRDIKPANYLVTEEWDVKLADFGEARLIPGLDEDGEIIPMSLIGSPGYIAPEMLVGKHGQATYDEKVDVYSLAMVLWQVVTRVRPWEEISSWQVQTAVLAGERPVIPENCPKEFQALITRAWDGDAAKRPSAKEIYRRVTEIAGYWNTGWNMRRSSFSFRRPSHNYEAQSNQIFADSQGSVDSDNGSAAVEMARV